MPWVASRAWRASSACKNRTKPKDSWNLAHSSSGPNVEYITQRSSWVIRRTRLPINSFRSAIAFTFFLEIWTLNGDEDSEISWEAESRQVSWSSAPPPKRIDWKNWFEFGRRHRINSFLSFVLTKIERGPSDTIGIFSLGRINRSSSPSIITMRRLRRGLRVQTNRFSRNMSVRSLCVRKNVSKWWRDRSVSLRPGAIAYLTDEWKLQDPTTQTDQEVVHKRASREKINKINKRKARKRLVW